MCMKIRVVSTDLDLQFSKERIIYNFEKNIVFFLFFFLFGGGGGMYICQMQMSSGLTKVTLRYSSNYYVRNI